MSAPRMGASNSNIVRWMRDVVAMEARTLDALQDSANGSWARAVSALARCKGKIVVTGTGKSGLIAQKVAATLASTGTPALYLHPADGMHGDVGLVQKRDLILAIGKSGESDELNSLLPALRRLGARIVAITASPGSTLARGADIVLETPVAREACPLNLSPTCSTTAALAVGDALAVALMKLRGFHREHFALLHPGGQLGRRLTLRVRDVMHAGADHPAVRVDAGIPAMLLEISRKHTGAVNVVDGRGRLRGLVTDYDLRRVLERGEDIRSKSIRDVMNPKPTVVGPDRLVAEAVELMLHRDKPFAVLPVADARGRALGQIHLHDIRKLGL